MKIIQTNLFLVIFILIFTSCGFKVVDNQALNNFTIKNVETTGDKRINFKIKNNILINSNENGINQLLISLVCQSTEKISFNFILLWFFDSMYWKTVDDSEK